MQSMSARSLLAGCLVGAVLCATSLYSSLKVIISGGGSLMAAALAYALFAMARSLSAHETNMSQTVASGAGTMASAAGLTAAIPALQLLGHEYSAGQAGANAQSRSNRELRCAAKYLRRYAVEQLFQLSACRASCIGGGTPDVTSRQPR